MRRKRRKEWERRKRRRNERRAGIRGRVEGDNEKEIARERRGGRERH